MADALPEQFFRTLPLCRPRPGMETLREYPDVSAQTVGCHQGAGLETAGHLPALSGHILLSERPRSVVAGKFRAGIEKNSNYRRAVSRYSDREQLLGINTYTGIETDRGVLLFDNTPEGRKLQKRYKDFLADKFFDPRLDITFFRTIDVIPDEVQRARINPVIDLDRLYSSEPEPFGVLSADCYTDMTEIGIHTERERYDMSATRENFVRFARMDKGSDIFCPNIPITLPACCTLLRQSAQTL